MAKYKRKTKEEREQELNKLTERMTAQIDSYFISEDALKEHLQFMSNFHNYSPRNMALIESQFKGAQAVGSFNFWKSKGVSVKKGERGIQILVPTPIEYFKRGEEWVQKRYANARERELIKNGALETQKRPFFKVGHVFEYTQTNAREKGFEVSKLFGQFHKDGNIENNQDMMDALEKVADEVGYTILDEPRFELGTAKGAAFPTLKEIALNPRNTDYENVTTLLHELAHAKLHSSKESRAMTVPEREFQAEMVSYVVAHKFGIDTEDFTLSYLGNWTRGGKELNEKERLLADVRVASKEFIEIIEGHLMKLEKEKELGMDRNTSYILDKFYADNVSFWKNEKERNPDSFKGSVEEQALEDVKTISTDPYAINGSPLDEKTKEHWIKQKTEMLKANEKDMDAHKFIVRSLENENGIDAEEIAQIVLVNGLTNKEHSFSVWAGDISNNELEPYYVYKESPQILSDDYTDLSDALLQDYILSDFVKNPTEVENKIQEYFKDGDKTFNIEITPSNLHSDLHYLIVDAEVSDILLKSEKGQLSKQDLIDFGRLVESDQELLYKLDHHLHKPIEEVLKQEGVTNDEEKDIQTAIKGLNVNLDVSDFQHNKAHEKSLIEYEYNTHGAYDELLVIQENNGLTSNRVELNHPKFEAQLAEQNPDDHLKYLSYKAIYQSYLLDYEPKAGEPVMMIHNGDKDLYFQPFGEVNNRDFKQDTVAYTVAIPDDNSLHVVSGVYNREEYVNPLHHIQKNEKLDKEKCGLLEKSFDDMLIKEENKYIQSIAPRIRQELER